jgi:hypothetical protein
MAVDRFSRDRIVRYARIVFVAVVLGAAIGSVFSAIVGVGVQFLGPLEGYRLGALVGSFIGGVYGGTSGLGVRGVIGGVVIGSLVGAGIGDAAWNAQLADVPNPSASYDIVKFPAVPLLKVIVLGAATGATVGGIAGAIPPENRVSS